MPSPNRETYFAIDFCHRTAHTALNGSFSSSKVFLVFLVAFRRIVHVENCLFIVHYRANVWIMKRTHTTAERSRGRRVWKQCWHFFQRSSSSEVRCGGGSFSIEGPLSARNKLVGGRLLDTDRMHLQTAKQNSPQTHHGQRSSASSK